MACLKRLLPAGYSGYSQIPAQSRSRSLPRWTKPPPAPGALLQTLINPFVLRALSFEALNLARSFLQYMYLYQFIFFCFELPWPLFLAAPQSHPWPGGEARGCQGLAGSAGVGRRDAPAQGGGMRRWSPAATMPGDPPGTRAGSDPLCLLPSPRLGLDSSAWRDLVSERPLPQSAFEWHS